MVTKPTHRKVRDVRGTRGYLGHPPMEGPFPVATEGDVFVVPNENLELARPAVEVPLDIPEIPE